MNAFVVPDGMPRAVFQNKYARRKEDGTHETWEEVADRVAFGNLAVLGEVNPDEMSRLKRAIASGVAPTSGRHLQQGDAQQPHKLMESFTNCFSGDTRVASLEYGAISLKEAAMREGSLTVRSSDGVWREATARAYGKQQLFTYTLALRSTSNVRLKIRATKNHRWLLQDGSETENLQVGDRLRRMPAVLEEMDPEAIRHGIVFGDGSAHRSRSTSERIASQGRQYCAIRLCGDKDRPLLKYFDGYKVTYPPHAGGDPVVYIGNRDWKDLPHTVDPSYIAGFIHGWKLADGSMNFQSNTGMEINSASEDAVQWLKTHACYAGYVVTGETLRRRKEGDGSYANGKDLHQVRLGVIQDRTFYVESVEISEIEEVYCLEEPVTHSFMLVGGVLTGNCSTAMASFLKFWLLMKGSGVSRLYDADMCRVNWDNMPNTRFVLEGPDQWDMGGHPDYQPWIENAREARHKYDSESEDVRWFTVEDSAEGWVKVVEVLETAAWQCKHKDKLFIFDFSQVRAKGTPIRGQQNRPASGPVPLIQALLQVAGVKGAGMRPWKQAMFVDHYLAACVAVGGVRRAARLAAKTWRDRDIFEFIDIKRGGFLRTANNSVVLDEEFWEGAKSPRPSHARRVFEAMLSSGYFDGTGEPGFVNAHLISWDSTGVSDLHIDTLFGKEVADRLSMHPRTMEMLGYTLEVAKKKRYPFLPNPCGEIVLACWGAYCVIADICLANAQNIREVFDAGVEMAKFLIRANQMPTLYAAEVKRTNRIGVSLTGIHEFAYWYGKLTWKDLVSPKGPLWVFLDLLRQEIQDAAYEYSDQLGVTRPHTLTTVKPSGTVGKVMNCTEGAHLPAYGHYLRWVQYSIGSADLLDLQARGYPVKDVSASYPGHVVVGFPTELPIGKLMGTDLVVAGEATPEEQYKWLQNLEKFWLGPRGNQVSYTLKYNPKKVPFEQFTWMMLEYQSTVRCCSVMAQDDDYSAYAYVPEERINATQYAELMSKIDSVQVEAYDEDALSCAGGACPIERDL